MIISKQLSSFLLFLAFTFTGCEGSPNNTEIKSVKENEHHHSEEEIKLNNGEKWIVEPSMLSIIRKMESEINHFDQLNFTELGTILSKDIEDLTSNCTMTGQAHDELHKWLLPYIDLVEELTQTSDKQKAIAIYDRLKRSFRTFNQYFK